MTPTKIAITSHGSGCIFRRWNGDRLEFLTFQYTRKNRTSWRFPYGGGRSYETPFRTLLRQMRNEVAKDHFDFGLNLIAGGPVYAELGIDERQAGGRHAKVFYLAEILHGHLRTVALLDRAHGRADETLAPPVWIGAVELLELMSQSPIAHQRAALFGLHSLMRIHGSLGASLPAIETDVWVQTQAVIQQLRTYQGYCPPQTGFNGRVS